MIDRNYDMEEVVLRKLQFKIGRLVDKGLIASLDSVQLESYYEHFLDGMVYELRLLLLGKTNQEVNVKYPKDWWQAVKERFAPETFLKCWPVEYTEITLRATEIYPNIALPGEKCIVQVAKF
jgi:hypothetical protein